MSSDSPKAAGGKARAAKLSPQERSDSARKAALAKAELKSLPKATHGSADHPLRIGDIEIPCYVLEDGTRVLSQRGFIAGVGMSLGSSRTGDARHIALLETDGVKPHVNNELLPMLRNPIRFQNPHGGGVAYGYPATILPDYCDAILGARRAGSLPPRQSQVADKCEILVRGFARVGIIALVDEATGYQKDRARDALAKILEAYVAKELQPWVKTFDGGYYEQIFRLRGLPYPPDKPNFRPQYFGKLTNDIVYRRLAPGVLTALKKESVKAEKKGKLHQHLTAGYGRQELLKHLGTVEAAMRLSDDWNDFMRKLNKLAPRFDETIPLDLEEADQ